ncbi:aminotransferase class V [Desulfofarcimen acetoxidans DSM 771]|uniref:Aminotransferase class V n=1 Tax=Desulfofarcimen acetoxidans (strain ATCC 49208 / DSM 771 / KCTC 5769 / VKM B-1644 / 5575) TaxID=485916 RepID=C8W036_DESAS|nr:alanine--glyoxylate aminotransferase family protein [Desulfofarcimen acetoxidans]ACV65004.1 aminotransferase class V [Desulfofarcimen acetoxidans DSM 771]
MKDKQYLLIPGPTPVPPTVFAAMSRPMFGHRSDDFAKMHKGIVEKMQKVFQTKNEVFVLTSSGTGAMEAAVSNVIKPGDKVLTLNGGKFGERWTKMAAKYGAVVDEYKYRWGSAADLKVIEEKLNSEPDYVAVFATHNETSTAVTNDIAGMGALVAKHKALLIVDTVSSLGAIEFKTDEWNVDIAATGSQKALMLPPGLGAITVSEKAWKVVEENKTPKFYFDLNACKKNIAKWNTPYTPNVTLFVGLDAALDMIMEEGLENVYARHTLLANGVRAAAKALGLELLADEGCRSDAVTAVLSPEGISAEDIRKVLKNDYQITFAGGQDDLKGKIFRIAHMGFADKMDMIIAIGALEMALAKVGYPVQLGQGVKALQEVFLGRN